jgi:hypothetical protein
LQIIIFSWPAPTTKQAGFLGHKSAGGGGVEIVQAGEAHGGVPVKLVSSLTTNGSDPLSFQGYLLEVEVFWHMEILGPSCCCCCLLKRSSLLLIYQSASG